MRWTQLVTELEPGDVRFAGEGAAVRLGAVLLWAGETDWSWSGSFRSPDWDRVRTLLADRNRLIDEVRD